MVEALQQYAKHELTVKQLAERTKKNSKIDKIKKTGIWKYKKNEYRDEKFGIEGIFKSVKGPIDFRDVVRFCKSVVEELEGK